MKTSEPPHVAELERVLHKLTISLGYPNTSTTKKHLKCIFQVIRQRASFEDSLKFIDMLPIPLKAMFLHAWHIPDTPARPLRSLDEFAEAVILASNRSIATPTEARQLLRQVFTFFGQLTSLDQMKEGLSFLPIEFQSLLMSDPAFKYQYSDTCIWLS